MTYWTVFWVAMAAAAVSAVASSFVRTPYGRFGAWGPSIDPRLGWVLMEAPAPIVFVAFFVRGEQASEALPRMFLAIWCVHYLNRGLLFPLRIRRRTGSAMGLAMVAIGAVVTTVHGYLNGDWIGRAAYLDASWLVDPRFVVGIGVYVGGFALNVLSDARLREIRRAGVDYAIPRGGAFRWVSCPNYLGELVAWLGFALATGSPGGIFILAISAANLVPRAIDTHRWYRERFPDYPPERRALVPYVW